MNKSEQESKALIKKVLEKAKKMDCLESDKRIFQWMEQELDHPNPIPNGNLPMGAYRAMLYQRYDPEGWKERRQAQMNQVDEICKYLEKK